jgi:hypothetical protein
MQIFYSAWHVSQSPKSIRKTLSYGAPEEIRTPDPQIRSLALEMLSFGVAGAKIALCSRCTAD